ncbi:hypothetical protein AVEN_124064-1, partial [Araneus ventricosus]
MAQASGGYACEKIKSAAVNRVPISLCIATSSRMQLSLIDKNRKCVFGVVSNNNSIELRVLKQLEHFIILVRNG